MGSESHSSAISDKACKRPSLLQSPGTPKPQNCILKSEKCNFGPPGKMATKVIQMSKKSSFGELRCPHTGFLDILINFWGHFSGCPKLHFSDFEMHFWGFGALGLCSRPGRLQDKALRNDTSLSLNPWRGCKRVPPLRSTTARASRYVFQGRSAYPLIHLNAETSA